MHPCRALLCWALLYFVSQCLAAVCGCGFDLDGSGLQCLAGCGQSALAPSAAEAMEAARLVFSWTKIRLIFSPCPVGVAPVPTRSEPHVTKLGYPGLSQFIW